MQVDLFLLQYTSTKTYRNKAELKNWTETIKENQKQKHLFHIYDSDNYILKTLYEFSLNAEYFDRNISFWWWTSLKLKIMNLKKKK